MKFLKVDSKGKRCTGYDSFLPMPEELTIVDFERKIPQDLRESFLRELAATCQELVLLLPLKDLEQEDWDLLANLPLAGFCLRMKLLPSPDRTARNRQCLSFAQFLRGKGRKMLVCLDLCSPTLSELGPTLHLFAETGVEIIFLNARPLDPETDARWLRQALEDLEKFSSERPLINFVNTRHAEWGSAHYWNNLSLNKFSGPKVVDIDVSNSCTHNCVFCGLYSPSIENSLQLTALRRAQVDRDQCLQLIDELPPYLELLQFGGAGDPFTHKSVMEFIRKAKNRGFPVEILTNFAYMDSEKLLELHQLAQKSSSRLEFFVNFSGATAETYIRTRPNQSAKNYGKIIQDLEAAGEWHRRDGKGMDITLMMVANRYNYHEMTQFLELGHGLGVQKVWIKPMEVHGPHTLEQLIPDNETEIYAQKLQEALNLSQKLDLPLHLPHVMEAVIEKSLENPEAPANASVQSKVQNGQLALDYYSHHPCRISLNYMRIPVDSNIYPCCIINRPIGSMKGKKWKEIWHSGPYNQFRQKMERIHLEKFHIKDPEWSFCQQCPHVGMAHDYGTGTTL